MSSSVWRRMFCGQQPTSALRSRPITCTETAGSMSISSAAKNLSCATVDERHASQCRSRRDHGSSIRVAPERRAFPLQGQISNITSVIKNTALAARLVPSMMGADGPRTYFMAFQTNAEVRGTGGLLGGYGILRFDKGVPTVDTLAPNTDLADAVGTYRPRARIMTDSMRMPIRSRTSEIATSVRTFLMPLRYGRPCGPSKPA